MFIRDYSEAFEPIQLKMKIGAGSAKRKPLATVTNGRSEIYFNIAAVKILPWKDGDSVSPFKFKNKFMLKKDPTSDMKVRFNKNTGGGAALAARSWFQ